MSNISPNIAWTAWQANAHHFVNIATLFSHQRLIPRDSLTHCLGRGLLPSLMTQISSILQSRIGRNSLYQNLILFWYFSSVSRVWVTHLVNSRHKPIWFGASRLINHIDQFCLANNLCHVSSVFFVFRHGVPKSHVEYRQNHVRFCSVSSHNLHHFSSLLTMGSQTAIYKSLG